MKERTAGPKVQPLVQPGVASRNFGVLTTELPADATARAEVRAAGDEKGQKSVWLWRGLAAFSRRALGYFLLDDIFLLYLRSSRYYSVVNRCSVAHSAACSL